ncbi:MAG: translation initiation factor IF-3 [Bacillariaceae sp.]|jgi:hypothetical protein
MAGETVVAKEESPKKGSIFGFGGKKGEGSEEKPKKEKKVKEKKVKKEKNIADNDNDDSSVCSTASNGEKNWLGQEKKKPRAEYQAEIDELKLKLVAVEDELATKTTQLNRFITWARQAPH